MEPMDWVTIKTSVITDEKLERIIEAEGYAVASVWLWLIVFAGLEGTSGQITRSPKAIAARLGVVDNSSGEPVENIIERAIIAFEHEKMLKKTRNGYQILNWSLHQKSVQLEEARKRKNARNRAYRDKIAGRPKDVPQDVPEASRRTSRRPSKERRGEIDSYRESISSSNSTNQDAPEGLSDGAALAGGASRPRRLTPMEEEQVEAFKRLVAEGIDPVEARRRIRGE